MAGFLPCNPVNCVMLVVVVLYIIQPVISQGPEYKCIAFPDHWNVSSLMIYDVSLLPIYLAEVIEITNSLTGGEPNGPTPVWMSGMGYCYIEITLNQEKQITIPIQMTTQTDDQSKLIGSIQFDEIIPLNQLRLTCNNAGVTGPTIHKTQITSTIKIEISRIGNGALHTSTAFDHTMYLEPIISHQYAWSPYNGAIEVKFSFYRPPNTVIRDFTLTHPLLDINTISSMHLPPEDPSVNDLQRLFPLLTRGIPPSKEIICERTTRETSSKVTFVSSTPNQPGTYVTKLILGDDIQPLDPITCTWTIEYPPDVLQAIFANNPQTRIVISYESGNFSTFPFTPPHKIIDRVRSSTGESTGVHYWISPHHQHEQMPSFEFGIAITDYSFQGAPETTAWTTNVKTVTPPNALHFTMGYVLHNGKLLTPTSILDWSPEIICFSHAEHADPSDATSLPISENGGVLLDLPLDTFGGFGRTCRVTLKGRPSNIVNHHGVWKLTPEFYHIDDQSQPPYSPLPFDAITLFDQFQRSLTGSLTWQYLFDTTSNDQALPFIQPIPFTKEIDDASGQAYAVGSMHVQPLLPYPIDLQMVFHLFFPPSTIVQDILPPVNQNFPYTLEIRPSNQPDLIDGQTDHAVSMIDFNPIVATYARENLVTIFQSGRPVRSPRLMMTIEESTPSLIMDATQPFHVTMKFPIVDDFNPASTTIYPMVSPLPIAFRGTYSPYYAHITPIRTAPLTGYSYRCVTWNRMAAPYVYDVSSTFPLTDGNSFPCSSYLRADAEDVDVSEPLIWRRTESMISNDQSQCFYELASVCVTPSATAENAYDIHPLADCPSFLGELHAVPCSLVEREPPTWDYTLEVKEVTVAHTMENGHPGTGAFVLYTQWDYVGDPRLSVDIAVVTSLGEGYGEEFVARDDAWVFLAHSVSVTQKSIHVGFPFFNPQVKSLYVRLTLTSHPNLESQKHTILMVDLDPSDSISEGCSAGALKQFNSVTHMCECEPQARPTTIVEPTMHPNDFTCVARCGDGFVWNPDTEQCGCSPDGNVCLHFGVCNPSTTQCTCFDGYFGDVCQYDDEDDIDYVCEQLECVAEHLVIPGGDDDDDDEQQECKVHVDADDNTSTVVCNCADGFTGDQCQHQSVCGVRQCVNGRLISPTGKPEECKCECNSTNITGSACNQCTLACRNGGVANTRCTACQCPAGYIGTTCTIPVWYHTFTLRNLPQHIVELILGTTASDKEAMAILQQTMVKYLLEDYSRVLSETFIVVDGNGNGSGGNDDDDDNDDTRIRVRVELSQFQTVIPPANPNAPYVHIQLMLYPADMTEEMLAYALQHGLVFDWSRVTDNLEFFRKFLREQGIVDDDDDLTPDIDDPGCTTRKCREKIIEEESSNHALLAFTPLLAMILSLWMCLATILTIF